MININFQLRDISQKTPQNVRAVFFLNKQRVRIDTGKYILPAQWSTTNQQALKGHEQQTKFNKLLKEMKDFILAYVENLANKKRRFYKDDLQADFNTQFKIGNIQLKKEGDIVDFTSFIQSYIKARQDVAEGTHQTLRGAYKNILFAFDLIPAKMLRQWEAMNIRERKLNPDFLVPSKPIEFDEINYKWMQAYHSYLLSSTFTVMRNGKPVVQHYSKNHIAKAIKIAKQFCTAAVDAGHLKDLTYKSIKASWEEADTVHLSWSEIDKLKALDFSTDEKEGMVRDLFVFNCYCGLRYSDLSRLDKNRFTNINGQLFLKIRMKKTDDLVKFPIVKSAEDILKKYDYQLPYVCDPTFNEHIKRICLKAGIATLEEKRETKGGKKLIKTVPKYMMVSSHTGRRSFATNFDEDGVPVRLLMAVTGHTTEKAFRKYVKTKGISDFSQFVAIASNR